MRGRQVSVSMSSLANGMGHNPHVEPIKDIGIPPKADASCDVKHGATSHRTGGRLLQSSGVVSLVPPVEKLSRRLSEISDRR